MLSPPVGYENVPLSSVSDVNEEPIKKKENVEIHVTKLETLRLELEKVDITRQQNSVDKREIPEDIPTKHHQDNDIKVYTDAREVTEDVDKPVERCVQYKNVDVSKINGDNNDDPMVDADTRKVPEDVHKPVLKRHQYEEVDVSKMIPDNNDDPMVDADTREVPEDIHKPVLRHHQYEEVVISKMIPGNERPLSVHKPMKRTHQYEEIVIPKMNGDIATKYSVSKHEEKPVVKEQLGVVEVQNKAPAVQIIEVLEEQDIDETSVDMNDIEVDIDEKIEKQMDSMDKAEVEGIACLHAFLCFYNAFEYDVHFL